MMWPYITILGGGTSSSIALAEKKGKEGKPDYRYSLGSAGAVTVSSALSNSTIESNFQKAIERRKAEISSTYVQQLSDEELEEALIQFGLLEQSQETNRKVL